MVSTQLLSELEEIIQCVAIPEKKQVLHSPGGTAFWLVIHVVVWGGCVHYVQVCMYCTDLHIIQHNLGL